jgi:WD40 repeat protein
MRVWKAHGGKLGQMVFCPNGQVLATSAGQSKFVSLWDAATGQRHGKLRADGQIQHLCFSKDGTFLAVKVNAAGISKIQTWQMNPPVESTSLASESPHYLSAITFLPEHDQLVAWSFRNLLIWSRPSLPQGERGERGQLPKSRIPDIVEWHFFVTVMRVTPDSSHLLLIGSSIVGIQLPTLKIDRQIPLPAAQIPYDAAFSPDSRWLVLVCGAKNYVLDWQTKEWLPTQLAHKNGARAAAFTPDGKQLLTVGLDGFVRFWDTRTWQQVRQFDFGIGKLRVAAISPSGTVAAAGSTSGEIVVWDIDE